MDKEMESQGRTNQNSRETASTGILPYLAWIVALLSVAGSLFFSEVMHLPPCVLCWYQRIAMYPLVLVIGTGIILRDRRMKLYSLPLCVAGIAIAVYHNLIYYGFIPEALTPCTEGVPCNAVQIEWLGFITIPLLGLAAFLSIAVCLLLYKQKEQ
jgi:disulfide bond formation protein DsbB